MEGLERHPERSTVTSESVILRKIMLAASKVGARLFRNNVGFAKYGDVVVKYGVGNPGGSDLIGIAPDGRFLAIEVKKPGEYPTPEQRRFIEGVIAAGGIAGVARSEEEAVALILSKSSPAASSRAG